MTNEQGCGRLGRNSISEIADKAGRLVLDYRVPRAVCLDPEGRVTVESPNDAIEDDLVGVYSQAPGLLALWRTIDEDLRFAAEQRGIAPVRSKYRERVFRGRAKKAVA